MLSFQRQHAECLVFVQRNNRKWSRENDGTCRRKIWHATEHAGTKSGMRRNMPAKMPAWVGTCPRKIRHASFAYETRGLDAIFAYVPRGHDVIFAYVHEKVVFAHENGRFRTRERSFSHTRTSVFAYGSLGMM